MLLPKYLVYVLFCTLHVVGLCGFILFYLGTIKSFDSALWKGKKNYSISFFFFTF